jgi:hypothetical protein
MKKLLLLTCVLILIGFNTTFAGQTDLFSYDATAVNTQMAQLDQLEEYVGNNPGITLTQMVTAGNDLIYSVNNINGIAGLNQINESALGIPSFCWGFCLGLVGILIVYMVSEDKKEVKGALVGCVIGTVVSGVLVVVSGYYGG